MAEFWTPQAGAVVPEPLEGTEQPADLPCGDDRPAVGDEQDGVSRFDASVHREPATAHVVHLSVLHQVGDEALGQPGITSGIQSAGSKVKRSPLRR